MLQQVDIPDYSWCIDCYRGRGILHLKPRYQIGIDMNLKDNWVQYYHYQNGNRNHTLDIRFYHVDRMK